MKGQWIGKTKGDYEGLIIINVDDIGEHFQGVAYVFPDNIKLPPSAASFETKDKKPKNEFKASTIPIDARTGLPCQWEDIKEFYPGVTHLKQADILIHFKENELYINAKTDIEIRIESKIVKKQHEVFSDVKGDIKTWEEYKNYVSSLSRQTNLFRGQRNPWKLRTSFHRKGRYDLSRFLNIDIPQLHQNICASSSHVFNLNIPNENGAFLNLVQHHGYPTPLLDWTYSPYVAAFFAFREVSKIEESEDHVRIFTFDHDKWKKHWQQMLILNTAGLHLSIMDFLAIENDRVIPQQAATTVTNIDDIELYIREKEIEKKCNYLKAIDISASDRNKVMRELSFMGITAGSLFPGLDGICEGLKEKMFDV